MMKKSAPLIVFLFTLMLTACSNSSTPSLPSEEKNPKIPAEAKSENEAEKVYSVDEYVEEGFKSGGKVQIEVSSITCYTSTCGLDGEKYGIKLKPYDSKQLFPFVGQKVDMIIEAEPENCGEEKETCNQVKNVSILENNTTPGDKEEKETEASKVDTPLES